MEKKSTPNILKILSAIIFIQIFILFLTGCDPDDGKTAKVVKPSATPSEGAVDKGATVTLYTSTEGAVIYYTIDGSTPTVESVEYVSPITITEAVTINAIALKEGMTASDILTVSYTIAAYTVTFNSNGGTAVAPITNIEYGAAISAPEQPTSSYGTFAGWYSNSALTSPFNFDTATVTSNITLFAKWTAAYELGDTGPGGGKVFYRNAAGFTVYMQNSSQNYTAFYLEAAPANVRRTNNMTTIPWCACSILRDPGVCDITDAAISPDIIGRTDLFSYYPEQTAAQIDALMANIGYGRKNTALIVNHPNHSGATIDNNAAKACMEYRYTDDSVLVSKNDWFLPSVGELYLLYLNRDIAGIGNYTAYWWSSSQSNNYMAWTVNFTGNKDRWYDRNKDYGNLYYVRPIRAF